MADNSKIQWCNATWNPIIGCAKISAGCQNCYAEKMARRLSTMPVTEWSYRNVIDIHGKWNNATFLNDNTLEKPFTWKTRKLVFVCSMGDLFHESVPFAWVDEVIRVIRWTKRHTYLFLTKRPERMRDYFSTYVPEKYLMDNGDTLENLWLGVTCENQRMADQRIPILLQIPAKGRFVSVEPMLGWVNLSGWLGSINCLYRNCLYPTTLNKIDWVIAGAESGPGRRPCKIEWIEQLITDCENLNIPIFIKQIFAGKKKISMPEINGKTHNQFPKF